MVDHKAEDVGEDGVGEEGRQVVEGRRDEEEDGRLRQGGQPVRSGGGGLPLASPQGRQRPGQQGEGRLRQGEGLQRGQRYGALPESRGVDGLVPEPGGQARQEEREVDGPEEPPGARRLVGFL